MWCVGVQYAAKGADVHAAAQPTSATTAHNMATRVLSQGLKRHKRAGDPRRSAPRSREGACRRAHRPSVRGRAGMHTSRHVAAWDGSRRGAAQSSAVLPAQGNQPAGVACPAQCRQCKGNQPASGGSQAQRAQRSTAQHSLPRPALCIYKGKRTRHVLVGERKDGQRPAQAARATSA